MNPFAILADITCDLSQELRDFCGMEDYITGHVHISDGRDFATTLDWENISRSDFYRALSDRSLQVTSAPASPEEYYLKFKEYAEQGCRILSLSISAKISSTYDVACQAAKRIREEFPETDIRCIDSTKMSGAFGLIVLWAHLMKKDGKSFEEIYDWIEENKHKIHQMGPIDDLIFVARRGRLSMGKAIMGSFAGVKPMGDCNRDGYVSVLCKTKGMQKALNITARYAEKAAVNAKDQYLIISHSDRQDYAETLKELLQARLSPKKIFISDVFSGCGTNIGPGMVAVYFIGNPLSEDLKEEKALMDEVLLQAK